MAEIIYQNSEKLVSYGLSIEDTMLSATGKTLEEWVEIAKTCPYTKYAQKLKWFKETYGILQNRAYMIFTKLEGKEILGASEPELLVEQLFLKSPGAFSIYETVALFCQENLTGTTISPRKAYVGFQHKYQYAAAIPSKTGLTLALAMPSTFTGNENIQKITKQLGGGDRLKFAIQLDSQESFNQETISYLEMAFHNS